MKKTKNKPYKNLITLLITFACCIFISVMVFVVTYAYTINGTDASYKKNIKTYIDNINVINNNTANFLSGQTINANKTKAGINNQTKKLQDVQNKVSSMSSADRYKSINKNLSDGIDANINFYDKLSTILNNPESSDIETSFNSLKKLNSDMIGFYSEINIDTVKINLDGKFKNFINASISYTEQLVKLKKNNDIVQNENNEFANKVQSIVTSFNKINENYKALSVNAGATNGGYDDVITTLTQSKSYLDSIKVDFSNISIPPKINTRDPIAVYNSLKKLLDDYGTYIDTITFCTANEKAQSASGQLDSSSESNLYSDSDLKYNTVTSDYSSLVQAFKSFKSSN